MICKHTGNVIHILARTYTQTHTHSQWHTHTQTFTHGRTTLVEKSALTGTSTGQYTTFTRDRQPCHRRDSKTQSQKVICRGTTSYTARPPASDNCSKSKLWIEKLYLTALNTFRSIDTTYTQFVIDWLQKFVDYFSTGSQIFLCPDSQFVINMLKINLIEGR